uniref:BTB domain-containing protein n=1 Tax=Moniliophthora roreri TaxID=221103 RepID=A0A0W0G0K9_MONRR
MAPISMQLASSYPCPVESCSLPVDVILKSSDGQLFGAHTKNLESFTEGFPLSGSVICRSDEQTELTENANVLKLFLAFTHNAPAPDLSSYDIDIIIGLAEAAEKYMNHFASGMCRKALRSLAEQSADNALRVLRFKSINNDIEDIDYVAERTVGLGIIHVLDSFGEHLRGFSIWLRYQQSYNEGFQNEIGVWPQSIQSGRL